MWAKQNGGGRRPKFNAANYMLCETRQNMKYKVLHCHPKVATDLLVFGIFLKDRSDIFGETVFVISARSNNAFETY